MTENKNILNTEIKNTMACTAYAEAGEPCPIGASGEHIDFGHTRTITVDESLSVCMSNDEDFEEVSAGKETREKSAVDEDESVLQTVEDTMACAAYAEAGEPCPLWNGDTAR